MATVSGSFHRTIDSIGASLGALVYRRDRFFGRSADSIPLAEAVQGATVEVDGLDPGVWHQVSVDTPLGAFDAGYLVHQWRGIEAPTMLFVHGSGEQPHDFGRTSSNSFRKLFPSEFDADVNLILLQAPFHQGSQGEYIRALGDLSRYVGMLASATALVDALAQRLSAEGCPRVYAVGISLGGWVVNLHRAYLGRGIARYVPMVAGTRLHEVFVTSDYRRLVAEPARSNPALLEGVLCFEDDFRANRQDDCYPLLARYDSLVEYEVQRHGYEGMDLVVLDKGHFAVMEAIADLRDHVRRSLDL